MTLHDYMRQHTLSDPAMARLVGGVTASQINKLRYFQRQPSARVAKRIHEITDGQVTLLDLMTKPSEVAA